MDFERFTTRALPRSEQFEAWRHWYGSIFETEARRPPGLGFSGENATWRSDGWALSHVRASAIGISRTERLIRRNPIDHWVITLTKKGSSQLTVHDQSIAPPVGLPFIVSLADILVNNRSNYEQVQLFLARDQFHSIAPVLDSARGTVVDTSRRRLLADYLLMLERCLPGLEEGEAARLGTAIETMVRACLTSDDDEASAPAGSLIGVVRMEQIRRIVRAHLRSPVLTPLRLCRETGMSRPFLYRLMEREGGVARYIRRQRLLESYRILADSSVTCPIARIAEELCFSSASAFSRAFREEFDMSPKDVQAAALAGLEPSRTAKAMGNARMQRLADCLRRL